jgi:hypothetical protein
MRTDELIRAMAADTAPRPPVAPVLAATIAALGIAVGGVALAVLGMHPALGSMMTGPLLLIRQVFPVLLALGAALMALRLARPGARLGTSRLLLAAAPIVAAAVVLRELALVPPAAWGRAALGETSASCLLSLALIGLPLLAGGLWALGRGASTRPGASGALAGLLAWSIAAAIYGLHCTEASPLFYAAWYGLALVGITALGAVLGARLLRW